MAGGEERAWTGWRMTVALFFLLLIGLPLGLPFLELLADAAGWRAWADWDRLLRLAGNTLRLVAGILAVALPGGIAAAVLLYRTDLPLRRFLRFLTLLTLFVPLPLFASAWQAALGPGGLVPLGAWSSASPGDPDVSPTGRLWKPWAQGMWAAIWIHAVAGLPWVIVLVGQGLRWVETELEEDALTAAGPWQVLWRVTLPRCRATIFAAGLWLALQAATEITITDTMQVRTFAEEVYTQIVAGGAAAVARSVAVAVPAILLTMCVVLWGVRRLVWKIPPLWGMSRPALLFRLGWARWPLLALALAAVSLLAAVPVASLVWKAGLSGKPEVWSASTAWEHLQTVFRLRGQMLAASFIPAAAAGVLAAGAGLILSWLATRARWFLVATFSITAAAWAMPGPVVGFGLKQTIARLLDLLHSDPQHPDPVAIALWYGPSPLPVLWAYVLRLFPFALALLWPVVRLIPVELHEAARVDGARPGQDLWYLVFPLSWRVALQAAVAVMILALGEISASKLVETPGSETFAHEIFVQMHYGVANDLAARCLLLLGLVVLGSLVFVTARWLWGAQQRPFGH